MESARNHIRTAFLPTIVLLLACFRLVHYRILWADEDYHLAAAVQMLHGKIPYRDFWYDKPPLAAVFYLINGALSGFSLRLLGAIFVTGSSYLAYCVARDWWSEQEGKLAAILLAFFFAFDLPSAIIPLAPDALMVLPHLAAIYYVRRGASFAAGICAGVAFLLNTKAIFVLASAAVFALTDSVALVAGCALPLILALATALGSGAWPFYCEQVWHWGVLYSRGSPVVDPLRVGFIRTLHWLGFHAVLLIGCIRTLLSVPLAKQWGLIVWLGLSFVAVCLGTRFAEHYYLQLLPPAVIIASRGLVLIWRQQSRLLTALLIVAALVPLVRFGPRYLTLALDDLRGSDPRWSDIAMDLDSKAIAHKIEERAFPGATLFVWGYRPNIYVYARLPVAERYWDSQPLTGIPADRHLSDTRPIYAQHAAVDRRELAQSQPTFIVDGLSRLNPRLPPAAYPELRSWLRSYRLVAQTRFCLLYQRSDR